MQNTFICNAVCSAVLCIWEAYKDGRLVFTVKDGQFTFVLKTKSGSQFSFAPTQNLTA